MMEFGDGGVCEGLIRIDDGGLMEVRQAASTTEQPNRKKKRTLTGSGPVQFFPGFRPDRTGAIFPKIQNPETGPVMPWSDVVGFANPDRFLQSPSGLCCMGMRMGTGANNFP